MTARRRQPTFIDQHTDLPAWVRSGARLLNADLSGYDARYKPRTVVRITATQVVCVEGHDPDRDGLAEHRYRRSNLTLVGSTGSRAGTLVDPHAEDVRNVLAAQTLNRVYVDTAQMHRDQITHVDREQHPRTVDAVMARRDILAREE